MSLPALNRLEVWLLEVLLQLEQGEGLLPTLLEGGLLEELGLALCVDGSPQSRLLLDLGELGGLDLAHVYVLQLDRGWHCAELVHPDRVIRILEAEIWRVLEILVHLLLLLLGVDDLQFEVLRIRELVLMQSLVGYQQGLLVEERPVGVVLPPSLKVDVRRVTLQHQELEELSFCQVMQDEQLVKRIMGVQHESWPILGARVWVAPLIQVKRVILQQVLGLRL